MLRSDADSVAIWSLWVAVVAAVAAIVAAVAAIWTLFYAKDAPTKEDLARVEENTATSSQHLEKVHSNIQRMDSRLNSQLELDALISKAQRVSIFVSGQNDIANPLRVRLTIKEPKVLLSRIELSNEVGTLFGSVGCAPEPDSVQGFLAVLDADTAYRWKAAGTATQMVNRARLILRVYMFFDGYESEVYREMVVHVVEATRRVEDRPYPTTQCLVIEGNV